LDHFYQPATEREDRDAPAISGRFSLADGGRLARWSSGRRPGI
jgi:hypothetical protein